MKIDTALKEFTEKYDREAIESIDEVSKELGLVKNGYTIEAFDINKAFSSFKDFLEGYGQYKVDNINNDKATSQELIQERMKDFINDIVFVKSEVKFADLPAFVESYINGISSILESVDNIKGSMIVAGVEQCAIGDVNDFTDLFITSLQESFYPAMDKILWASGYNSRQRLKNTNNSKKEKVLFL